MAMPEKAPKKVTCPACRSKMPHKAPYCMCGRNLHDQNLLMSAGLIPRNPHATKMNKEWADNEDSRQW